MGLLERPQQLVALLFIASGVLSTVVAMRAAQFRQGSVWRYLVYFAVAAAVWCFSEAFFWVLATTDAERWFWLYVGYSASVLCVSVTFAFALYFARLDHWLTTPVRILLAAPFVLAVLLTLTNAWHGLIWDPELPSLAFKSGPGHGLYFFFMLPVSYGLLFASIAIFLQSLWRLNYLYRQQAILLSIAVLLPVAASILYFTPLNPWPAVDLAPAAMAATGVLLLYCMTRLHMMDLRPIYRDAIFRHTTDGVLVLDSTGRILDMNPVAQAFLTGTAGHVGGHAGAVLATQFALDHVPTLRPGVRHFLTIDDQPPRYFELTVTSIEQRSSQAPLLLLIWRDTSQLREAIANLYEQKYLLHEHLRADAEYNRRIERAVETLRMQIQVAQVHLDHGRLGAAAAVLAQLNSATLEGSFKRASEAYATAMQDITFFDAVAQYVERFAGLNGLDHRVTIDATLEASTLAPAAQMQAVHILQDALDNVHAHAHARQVAVSFERSNEGIVLVVQDDGVGFDMAQAGPGLAGSGIATMHQRAQAIDATLTIAATPGSGTRVRAVFPPASSEALNAALRGKQVLLADRFPIVVEGLSALLSDCGVKMHIVAPSLDAIVPALRAIQPDLALLDAFVLGPEAVASIRLCRGAAPSTRMVLLLGSGQIGERAVYHSGADGYLPKTLAANPFVEALAQIAIGAMPLIPDLSSQLLSEFRRQGDAAGDLDALTARQREILHLVVAGLTYNEIGAHLSLRERTVRYHVNQIRSRLGLSKRTELAAYGRRHGLGGKG